MASTFSSLAGLRKKLETQNPVVQRTTISSLFAHVFDDKAFTEDARKQAILACLTQRAQVDIAFFLTLKV